MITLKIIILKREEIRQNTGQFQNQTKQDKTRQDGKTITTTIFKEKNVRQFNNELPLAKPQLLSRHHLCGTV